MFILTRTSNAYITNKQNHVSSDAMQHDIICIIIIYRVIKVKKKKKSSRRCFVGIL